MHALSKRISYFLQSTKGLALLAIAIISVITAIWGTLSGPMVEWGVKEITVRLLGLDLDPSDREGRIVMLYHSIAMAIVAIEVYFITDIVPMKKHEQNMINATVTVGYLLSIVFGFIFAYFGHNYVFHGLFLAGQTLVFFTGVLLAAALWPWKKEYRLPLDSPYAHTKKGLNLERTAFFVMAIATLGSALFGAVTGSYWGNGQETFLAEDLIREPIKTALQLAIIGHLHIMLTLIAVALTLIVGRWQDFKGKLHKASMILMIIGTIVITLGVWSVVPYEAQAHTIIYVGSVPVMFSALLFVIFSWDKLIRTGLAERNIKKGNFIQKMQALLRDPLRFGVGWQMVFMNFTVSGVGLFMAAKLDEVIRVWSHREERITLTGHWHILSSIVATIILMYFADIAGLKGKARKWFGWILIIGSDIAFGSVTVFSLKRLFLTEAAQQPLVDTTMLLTDFGLGAVLIVLAMFMLWRLFDLFRKDGRWSQEYAEAGLGEDTDRIEAQAFTAQAMENKGGQVK